MKIRTLVKNQKGLTLIEMLIAILIFILAAVFIVSLVTNALDKPKEAGILNDFNHYEQSGELLLRTIKDTADESAIETEFNKGLDKQAVFISGESQKKNAYKNNYKLKVDKAIEQTAIIVDTQGKSTKDKYKLVIVKEGKIVESCTYGFGRNNKKLKSLESEHCDGVSEDISAEPPFVPVALVPNGCVGIYDAEDLYNVRNNLDGCYTVMNAIDLSIYPNWETIALSETTPFTGSFDGQRYQITGLTINTLNEYGALFGTASDATFANVNLVDVGIVADDYAAGLLGDGLGNIIIDNSSVSGSVLGDGYVGALVGDITTGLVTNSHTSATMNGFGYVGGLVGYMEFTTISDSYSTGTVTVTDYNAGGLVAYADESLIRDSYSTGDVYGESEIGGLSSFLDDTDLINSYSTGNVTATEYYAGGLIASAESDVDVNVIQNSYSTGNVTSSSKDESGGFGALVEKYVITNSYSLGNVTITEGAWESEPFIGGFIGRVTDTTISNSYSAGVVTGFGELSGFIGKIVAPVAVTDSYYNSGTVGTPDISGATPKTSTELKQQVTFTGWDFSDVWELDGANYPTLK